MPVPVLPEDVLELEELLVFVEGFVELVALEPKLVLEPVDPVVEELLPVSIGLFKLVPLEATLGFELANPKNPPPLGSTVQPPAHLHPDALVRAKCSSRAVQNSSPPSPATIITHTCTPWCSAAAAPWSSLAPANRLH